MSAETSYDEAYRPLRLAKLLLIEIMLKSDKQPDGLVFGVAEDLYEELKKLFPEVFIGDIYGEIELDRQLTQPSEDTDELYNRSEIYRQLDEHFGRKLTPEQEKLLEYSTSFGTQSAAEDEFGD